ncbi:hypothetical protein HN587_07395 [Candidatus Woesearchaeota archaeon]|jgi:hypothetical protein|nr:hypothetical protein [Candidatus Woesearchaeota archaeon]
MNKTIVLLISALVLVLIFVTGCSEPSFCGNNIVEKGETCEKNECSSNEFCNNCQCTPIPAVPGFPEE